MRWSALGEKGAGDFVGGEATQQTQRECYAPFGGKHRMTRGEDQAQEVVSDVVIDGVFEIGHGQLLLGLELAT